MLYHDVKPLFRNILLILMRHLWTKMLVLLNCHGLIINIKRVQRRTINPRVKSEQNHSNQPFVSTGSRCFSGPRSNQWWQMLVDCGDHIILYNTWNSWIQLPSFTWLIRLLERWIDCDVEDNGRLKWKDSVFKRVEKGNAPSGQSMRTGILVCGMFPSWSYL